ASARSSGAARPRSTVAGDVPQPQPTRPPSTQTDPNSEGPRVRRNMPTAAWIGAAVLVVAGLSRLGGAPGWTEPTSSPSARPEPTAATPRLTDIPTDAAPTTCPTAAPHSEPSSAPTAVTRSAAEPNRTAITFGRAGERNRVRGWN